MRLIADPNRPNSSLPEPETRVSNLPSAILSVARVICLSDRVILRTRGSQKRTEKRTSPIASQTHGVASKKRLLPNKESDDPIKTIGGLGGDPGAGGILEPNQYPTGSSVRRTNRPPASPGLRGPNEGERIGRSGGGPSPTNGRVPG